MSPEPANPHAASPLYEQDRAVLRLVRRTNDRLRELLCTLARRGVALRRATPDRARCILDALAPWPFYKGGQFLFDLLEWEDLMIDGPPPAVLTRADLDELLTLPVRWLLATVEAAEAPAPLRRTTAALNLPVRLLATTARSFVQSALRDFEQVLSPPQETAPDDHLADHATDQDPLPELQSGFYLYEDVVLGLFDLVGPHLPAPPREGDEGDEGDEPTPDHAGPDSGDDSEGDDTMTATQSTAASPAPKTSATVFPIEETFRVTEVEDLEHDWTLLGDAVLTGDDGLRLTPNEQYKAGTALLGTPFPAESGVSVEFDYYASGGQGDGFAVYLIDGAHDTGVGGYGAGLGYSLTVDPGGKIVSEGVSRGYLGVGFDIWGNFSTTLAGPSGGTTRQPDKVALRGSGNERDGFHYLTGADAPGGLAATWDDQAHVQVVIVDAVVTVHLTRAGRTTTVLDGVDLKPAPGQDAMPETFKFGLSGSTGYHTSLHSLRNLVIALPAKMPLRVTGPDEVPAGSEIAYTIAVRNDGPNSVPNAEVAGTLVAGLSNATVAVTGTDGGARAGQGNTDGQDFTQRLDLPVGGSATITVTGTTGRSATGQVTCTASIGSPEHRNTAQDRSDSHTTRLTAHVPQDDLQVCQQGVVSVKPGEQGHIAISVANPDDNAVDLPAAELVFDAPTGFEWTGTITFTHYNANGQTVGTGDTTLEPVLEDDNTRLRLTGLQDLRSAEGYVLAYALGIKAKPDAVPGRRTDGKALVADSAPLRLTATVQGADEGQSFTNGDGRLPVIQPAVVEVKQGESGFLAVTVGFEQDGKQEVGTLDQRFRAPAGFTWNGYISYSYYSGGRNSQGGQGDIEHRITDGGTTFTITGMPELRASKGLYLTYVLGLTADEDAEVGRHDDGEAKIGAAAPLALHATVFDKDEPARCNR
ncbi:hypothetical protein [Actinosynnema sp. NPDC023587]|uniref:hypothetical protein n=1 Tax=Actinosynnema sp. NPDC023587 TaxID=3154695 RepID=UPI0033EC0DBF